MYVTAVLEYYAGRVLELAGHAVEAQKRWRIVPRHVVVSVLNDEEVRPGGAFEREPDGEEGGDAPPLDGPPPAEQSSAYLSHFLYRVLKRVHPDVGISRKAMSLVNSIVRDLFDRFAVEGGRLASRTEKKALTSVEMEAAVRGLVRGENALLKGEEAVTRFNSSKAARIR